ncbi:hypothetical protein B0H11DRAFT_2279312 [Mycena galericulata]|nr:hypothetical protein B0H11DRAFT_2279312 [Mycena galericulata]
MPRANVIRPGPSHLVGSCPEIILSIMRFSGPADLRIFGSVCSLFKSILHVNPSIWQYARASLKIPAPTALTVRRLVGCADGDVVGSSVRGSTEENYIEYLFRGGHCTVCGIWTMELPCSFSLDFRCCSTKCRQRVFSVKANLLVTIKTSELDKHPGIKWITPHSVPRGGIYFRSDVAAAEEKMRLLGQESKTRHEFEQVNDFATFWAECRLSSFESLEHWRDNYIAAVGKTRKENLSFLKAIAHTEVKNLHCLLTSPTLNRVFTAFNRDLTKMGINDWRIIQLQVRRELKALR